MEQVFILYIWKKLSNFFHSLKKKLKDNFFILLGLFLFIFFIFITTNVKAVENSNVIEDFELQDYLNQNLMNGGWCLVMTKDTNDIYLITLSETAYKYLICSTSIDDSGIIYPSGTWTSMSQLGAYNRQANVVSYKFNKDTKKFGSRTSHSIGTFNPGACYLLKSGCDIYQAGSWKKFYTADGPLFTPPYIDNSEEELANQDPNIIKILPASLEDNIIHLEICSYSIDGLDSTITVLQDISLDFGSEFCVKEKDEGGIIQNLHYEIPFSSLTAEFVSGDTYMFRLVYWDDTETKRTNSKFVTMKVSSSGGSGSEDDKNWSELGRSNFARI